MRLASVHPLQLLLPSVTAGIWHMTESHMDCSEHAAAAVSGAVTLVSAVPADDCRQYTGRR